MASGPSGPSSTRTATGSRRSRPTTWRTSGRAADAPVRLAVTRTTRSLSSSVTRWSRTSRVALVGPVQVVDRQQHGPLRGEAAEQTGDRLHQPRPLDVGIGTDRRRPEPLDQPAEAVEALDQAVPLSGPDLAEVAAQGGGDRAVGHPSTQGVPAAFEHREPPGPAPRSAGRRAPRSSPCRLRPRGRPHRHRRRGPPARAPRCSAPDRRRDRAARREGTGVLHGSRTSGVRPSRPAPQWAAAGRPPPSRPSTAPRRPPR